MDSFLNLIDHVCYMAMIMFPNELMDGFWRFVAFANESPWGAALYMCFVISMACWALLIELAALRFMVRVLAKPVLIPVLRWRIKFLTRLVPANSWYNRRVLNFDRGVLKRLEAIG